MLFTAHFLWVLEILYIPYIFMIMDSWYLLNIFIEQQKFHIAISIFMIMETSHLLHVSFGCHKFACPVHIKIKDTWHVPYISILHNSIKCYIGNCSWFIHFVNLINSKVLYVTSYLCIYVIYKQWLYTGNVQETTPLEAPIYPAHKKSLQISCVQNVHEISPIQCKNT